MGTLALLAWVGSALPGELPLDGRARGIVDLQGKCLNQNYMKMTSRYPGGGCPEYVRGVQIGLEWSAAEPPQGVYNFSAIESALSRIAAMGKYAVIKLTGGRKPRWMYDQIPQNADVCTLNTCAQWMSGTTASSHSCKPADQRATL
jgi:hypothetical protein